MELATVYGGVFAEQQRLWLQSLLDATLEATSADTVVPDDNPKHLVVNSPSHRQIRSVSRRKKFESTCLAPLQGKPSYLKDFIRRLQLSPMSSGADSNAILRSLVRVMMPAKEWSMQKYIDSLP